MPIDLTLEDPNQDEDMDDPNIRRQRRLLDSSIQNDGELSDSDDEGEGGRRNHASHRERDSIGPAVSRRFGVGIMGGGPAGASSGGPSMHTIVPPIVMGSSGFQTPGHSENMDIDEEVPRTNGHLSQNFTTAPSTTAPAMKNGINGHSSVLESTSSGSLGAPAPIREN